MIGLYAHGKLPLELGTEAIGALLQDVESLDAINDCGRTQEIIANDILVSRSSMTFRERNLAEHFE